MKVLIIAFYLILTIIIFSGTKNEYNELLEYYPTRMIYLTEKQKNDYINDLTIKEVRLIRNGRKYEMSKYLMKRLDLKIFQASLLYEHIVNNKF